MNVVLKNNIFEFDGEHYLQLQGTAMGTKMAPAYANLFMADIEEDMQRDLLGLLVWRRYIDDIFVITDCSNEEFEHWMERANQIPDQFTHEIMHLSILTPTLPSWG